MHDTYVILKIVAVTILVTLMCVVLLARKPRSRRRPAGHGGDSQGASADIFPAGIGAPGSSHHHHHGSDHGAGSHHDSSGAHGGHGGDFGGGFDGGHAGGGH